MRIGGVRLLRRGRETGFRDPGGRADDLRDLGFDESGPRESPRRRTTSA